MSSRFAVVHEAEADFVIASELADRVVVESVDWIDEEHLPHLREWIALASDGRRFTWKELKHLAREAGIRVHGHFDGEPHLPDALAARRAILYLLKEVADLKAILLIRDQDRETDRRRGLEQARQVHYHQEKNSVVLIVGLAIVERECWVLSGFEPQTSDEIEKLESMHQELGCDPRTNSHDLTACKNDQALRSAKRVLNALSRSDRDRESLCWRQCDLELLRERGRDNGLAAYLQEIAHDLAPLFGHVRQQER